MASIVSTARNADQIYMTGPETLVAESSTILAGEVSSYSKQIETVSQPGADGMPLTWVVVGRLDRPEALKGTASGQVPFSRQERSIVLPTAGDRPQWELGYGDLVPGDRVVIFQTGGAAHPATKVLPSGSGERDLIALIKDIVAVQALPNQHARADAWAAYILRTNLDAGRQAGLRSLLHEKQDWAGIAPTVQHLFEDHSLTDSMHAYTFGFIASGVMQNRWRDSASNAVDLLCREFESEKRLQISLQYILHLKLLLRYTTEEATRAEREPLRARIVASLQRAHASGAKGAELSEQYRQIQAAYPGIW